MYFSKSSVKRLFAILALAGGVVAGLPLLTWAGGNSGLTIFSGVDRADILNYYLQFGGHPRQWDRYKLYIAPKKLPQGASTFLITYPDYFDGKFNTDRIEVRTRDGSLPIKEVILDEESRRLEIVLEKEIEPNTKTEIVMSNVRNPNMGTYYFRCDAIIPGDIPVPLYVGTWIVSIER
jgi:hypothetical protein